MFWKIVSEIYSECTLRVAISFFGTVLLTVYPLKNIYLSVGFNEVFFIYLPFYPYSTFKLPSVIPLSFKISNIFLGANSNIQ